MRAGCDHVGGVSCAPGFEPTEIDCFVIHFDAGGIKATGFIECHTFRSGFLFLAPSFAVRSVGRIVGLTQIAPAVIGRIAIRVIDHTAGPTPSHVNPSQATCHVDDLVKANLPMTIMTQSASNIASSDVPLTIDTPKEQTGCRIVVEQCSQSFRR
jgi:hypothetical protein